MKEFYIESKKVTLYCTNKEKDQLPVIVLNSYSDESEKVFEECAKLKCNDFILIAISNIDWNNEMTPYYAPKLYKNDSDYLGRADEYIKLLESKIIPVMKEYIANELKMQISYFGIAGYSLGGLFAVYSIYKTALFTRIASASGSFWYPKIVDFIRENKTVSKVEKIYFSLGDQESKTQNKVFMSVETNTKEIEQFYRENGIATIYEENEGNHFQDAEWRMAKGIKWILE